jgi:hypothetical protein
MLYRFFRPNPTVEPIGRVIHVKSAATSASRARVLRPPRAAPLQYVAGKHLTTARVCFLGVRVFLDCVRLDNVPDSRRVQFALPSSTMCCGYASSATGAARMHSQCAFGGWVRLVSGGACDIADAAAACSILRRRCMIWPDEAANRTWAAQSHRPRPATPARVGCVYLSRFCVCARVARACARVLGVGAVLKCTVGSVGK